MSRVVHASSIQVCAALCVLAFLVLAPSSTAQSAAEARPDTRGAKTFASSGALTVQIQDTAGAPFFEGAKVTLLTRDIDTKLSMISDQGGHARFTALPVGQYVVEITAPGYRTVQEQVFISGTREAPNIMISMVPSPTEAKVKVGSLSVSPKAVKESERALRALQLNRLAEAQQHLALALAFDPNFADGNYLMGLLLLRQKQSAKATAYLQKSLNLSPDHAAALLALGEAQYLERDYSRAIESLNKFLRDQPHSPQAAAAQKYIDVMRRFGQPQAASDTRTVVATSDSAPVGGADANNLAGSADSGLPPLAGIAPATEANWAPPNVDDEKLDFDSAAVCQLDEVIQSAGHRIQELVQNVDRFTATEAIEHFNLSPMGLEVSRETRKFEYLVEIHRVGNSDLDVQEYRNGSVATEEFPGDIATVGLPSLALLFHPYLRPRYEFQCEGRGSWHDHPAWVIHFQQRTDHTSGMLVYHVGRRFIAVGLKGRAWIDAATSQIVAMESDIMQPIPEIRLFRDHQLVEYGPVSFRNNSMQLWLPKSADWYCSMSGRRFHRRHAFSQFLLFSVDDKQQINAPKEPVEPHPQ